MRRLIRLLAGRRANGERGAVLVLTAFLVAVVAIAMLALTIDLGNATYNRAQLQNGADAASLSLATACAEGTPNECVLPDGTSNLTQLAEDNANATDQSMSILTDDNRTCISSAGRDYVTAHSISSNLPTCADPTTDSADLSSCQPWPLSAPWSKVSYVEVTTQTEMKDGSSRLPFYFGKGEGFRSETCSRAAWGPAGSTGPTIPITISQCAYDDAVSKGYAPGPPYSPGPNADTRPQPPSSVASHVDAIRLHAKKVGDCTNATNGQTYPGGFGWLQTTDSDTCVADVSIGDADEDTTGGGSGDTGRKPPNACKNNTQLQSYVGEVVYVPIYDGYDNSGSSGVYSISGIAAFYLAGFVKVTAVPNQTYEVYSHSPTCTNCTSGGSDTYFWGWFVEGSVPGGHLDPNGPDLGAHVVVPAG